MDRKVVLVCGILLLFTLDVALAEFLYNRILPKTPEELEELGLKCIPGRTIMKMVEIHEEVEKPEYSSDEYEETRRFHMRFTTDDESCQICVCSVEGKDEYCSKRPAMNVNECMRMATLTSQFEKNEPFEHERTLSWRIRRDLIWHKDDIPYNESSACYRGFSYYSNSPNANDTDLDVASDVTSLLDYNNTDICFYCVCSVSGDSAKCIPRTRYFCQYFRDLRQTTDRKPVRDRYRQLFQQDRPTYFSHINWRLRRTMDDGMFDYIDNVGAGNQKCTPFVSVYSDCTEENRCTGCHKCTCSAEGSWKCDTITENCGLEDEDIEEDKRVLDDGMIQMALDEMLEELQETNPEIKKQGASLVPAPRPRLDQSLIGKKEIKVKNIPIWELLASKEDDGVKDLLKMFRRKRSTEEIDGDEKSENKTVKFHNTVDEINEDVLKTTNKSGTITAEKVDMQPIISRRSPPLNNSSTSLQIEYSPPVLSQHATDNKVDTPTIHDDQIDFLVHHNIYNIAENKTQVEKDKYLSKIVVNELKPGQAEIIGDNNSPVISNITFTPENDTLTAMAFIAGNLLNKLWNIEKDSDDSLETEHLKKKKINDLLDLFKEPLNLRQETFLRNALQQLSSAIGNENNINVSLCENIQELKKRTTVPDEPTIQRTITKPGKSFDTKTVQKSKFDKPGLDKTTAAAAAYERISHILDLIRKFEHTQNVLNVVKNNSSTKHSDRSLSEDEKMTLNIFGSTVESLTKLLIPNKKGKNIVKAVKSKNFLNSDQYVNDRYESLNLTGKSLTAKDKIVLDYLRHIQSNPNCLLSKQEEKPFLPNIEGNILLNLSEFLKIKSMSDLFNLIDSKNKKEESSLRTESTTTKTPLQAAAFNTESASIYTTEKARRRINDDEKLNQFESTKEKLKRHLKNILEDIMELQNFTGNNVNASNILVSEALPCIYNLLRKKSYTKTTEILGSSNKRDKNSFLKITNVLNNLKKELNHTLPTRRSYIDSRSRPKSAVVWERTVKNIANKVKLPTRRSLSSDAPKSLNVLKTLIDKIETDSSNSYKTFTYLSEVPAAERLVLLKTLALDTKKFISVLNDISKFTEVITDLNTEDYKTVSEFIDNANTNIKLNNNVLIKIQKLKPNISLPNHQLLAMKLKNAFISEEEKPTTQFGFNPLKLTRDQIINQLIKNRMLIYTKLKQGNRDKNQDMKLILANKILFYLEIGNNDLARELFKVFVEGSKKKLIPTGQFTDFAKSETMSGGWDIRRVSKEPEPLIQFEDPKVVNKYSGMNQDQLLKQLINMKNL